MQRITGLDSKRRDAAGLKRFEPCPEGQFKASAWEVGDWGIRGYLATVNDVTVIVLRK